jgi:hypothetical protein
MALELFANNAHGLLSAGISSGDLSLTLQSGEGALFPSPGSGEFFRISLVRADLSNQEIVYCTGRSGDVLTIERAKEDTTAIAFFAGDRVRLRPTAGMINDIASVLDEESELIRYDGWSGCGTGANNFSEWGLSTNIQSPSSEIPSHISGKPSNRPFAASATQLLGAYYGISYIRFWRGNAANRGGFDIWLRWAASNAYDTWVYAGMDSTNGAYSPATTNPPYRLTIGQIGFGTDMQGVLGTTYKLLHSSGGGSVTQIDTGIPRSSISIMMARFYAPPNASYIDAYLTDLITGAAYTNRVTTNLPTTSQFLVPRVNIYGASSIAIHLFGCWSYAVNQSEPI